MKPNQFRQGDVFLLPARIPAGATKTEATNNKVILALGEATGHHHRIEVLDRPDVEAYEKDGKTYLRVSGDAPADLLHEEHGRIPVAPGDYEARTIFGEAAYATEGHGPETRWKEYWEGVPPDMETCAQAVAWGFGMTESEYAPAMET